MIYNAFFPRAALFQVISWMLGCTRLEVRQQFINHFVLSNRKWRAAFFFGRGCLTEFLPTASIGLQLSLDGSAGFYQPTTHLMLYQQNRGPLLDAEMRITQLDKKHKPVLLKHSQCRQLYSNLGGSYSCLILLCCVFPVHVRETKINISHGLLPASE